MTLTLMYAFVHKTTVFGTPLTSTGVIDLSVLGSDALVGAFGAGLDVMTLDCRDRGILVIATNIFGT
jgi:hypothetical protein